MIIATRGSPLALWQANHVRDRLLLLQGNDDAALWQAARSMSG